MKLEGIAHVFRQCGGESSQKAPPRLSGVTGAIWWAGLPA